MVTTSPAAAHALAVLAFLALQAEPVPAALIAREVGLPRSTTYRLLATLVEHGFAGHLPDAGGYALGAASYELGWAYQRQVPLQRIARSYIARLVETTGHNAHLAVLHGRDVLYVIEERAPGRPSLVSDVGVRLPAELTASGLAMLAGLPARQVTALYPDASVLVTRTGVGPRRVSELRRILGDVRRQGYSEEVGSVTEGLSSVAVAVRDAADRTVAAVAITFPSGEYVELVRRHLHSLRTCADALTGRLSHRG